MWWIDNKQHLLNLATKCEQCKKSCCGVQRWTEHLPSKLATCLVLFLSLRKEKTTQLATSYHQCAISKYSCTTLHCSSSLQTNILVELPVYHYAVQQIPAYSSSWLLNEKFTSLIRLLLQYIYSRELTDRECTGPDR